MDENENNEPQEQDAGFHAARQLIEGAAIVGMDGQRIDPERGIAG